MPAAASWAASASRTRTRIPAARRSVAKDLATVAASLRPECTTTRTVRWSAMCTPRAPADGVFGANRIGRRRLAVQPAKKLDIARWPRKRASFNALCPPSQSMGRFAYVEYRLAVQLRFADDTALAQPVFAHFELRFDHQHHVSFLRAHRRQCR